MPIEELFDAPTVEMAAVIEAHQGKKLGEEELGSILDELESLSDLEAKRLLTDYNGKPDRID